MASGASTGRSDRPGRSKRTDRGQTLIDYVSGVSIFLLVVAFSFTFVPSFSTPFQAPIQSDQTAQADRVALATMGNLTVNTTASVVNGTRTTEFFSAGTSPTDGDDLREQFHLPDHVRVNVTLKTVDALPDETVGDPYRDHAVAASTRIVTDDGTPVDRCRPTCRLVVRIW